MRHPIMDTQGKNGAQLGAFPARIKCGAGSLGTMSPLKIADGQAAISSKFLQLPYQLIVHTRRQLFDARR